MLSRRHLLAGLAGTAVLGSLASCTATPPQAPSSTALPPAPTAVRTSTTPPLAHVTEALGRIRWPRALAHQLIRQAKALGLSPRQLATIKWLADTIDRHAMALESEDPLRRPTAEPSHISSAKVGKGGLRRLREILTDTSAAFKGYGLEVSGVESLLWASMACCYATAAHGVEKGMTSFGTDTSTLAPADIEPGAADEDALATCHQMIYGLQVALAPKKLAGPVELGIRQRGASWRNLRDALQSELATASVSPTPAPPAYKVDPPTNSAQAKALAARLESAALPHLGNWIANTERETCRKLGIDQLFKCQNYAVKFGAPLLRWPGWSG